MIVVERAVLECLRANQLARWDQTMTTLTITQHITMATMTEAMRRARGMVKDELKRHRVRLADVDAKDITSWALVYLDDHPELIADARPVIESWFARGVFLKTHTKGVQRTTRN
jgi:hypothetical protein